MDNSLNKKRNRYIDVAKGLGIILVIIGHLDKGGQFSRELIFAFHMPLFFALSGVFSKTSIGFKDYFLKALKSLYLPYFLFVLLDTVVYSAIDYFTKKTFDYAMIKSNLTALVGVDFAVHNRALWFLFALFVIKVLYYFIDKNIVLKIMAVILGILCVAFSTKYKYPEGMLYIVLLPGLSFYTLGNVFSKQIKSLPEYLNKKPVMVSAIVIATGVAFVYLTSKNVYIDMTKFVYGNTLLYFINSTLGIVSFLGICSWISYCFSKKLAFVEKALCYYGTNSLYILMVHYYFCRRIFPLIMKHYGYKEILYTPQTQLVLLALMLLIMIPLIYIFDNYLYFAFGKKKPAKPKK